MGIDPKNENGGHRRHINRHPQEQNKLERVAQTVMLSEKYSLV